MDEKNIYNKLKDILEKAGGKYTILEEQVDVDLQMKFFECTKELSKYKRNEKDVINDSEILYKLETTVEQKKELLAELSNCETVEAFRILENYLKVVSKDMQPWAILSFQHCRIGLESKLLDEHKVFISTGLGGKEDKLRYFVAFKNKLTDTFNETQKKIVRSEFDYIFKKSDCVIEEINFLDSYISIFVIMPIDCDINETIKFAISESNQYGNFLDSNFLITNVKQLQKSEIEYYFNKKEKS